MLARMLQYDRTLRAFATSLAFLAGFVDAIGFLKTGGFFISFMSGNSTRLAVSLAARTEAWVFALSLIALFLGGVILGSLLPPLAGPRRKVAAIALMAALLLSAAVWQALGWDRPTIASLALAMGAANTIFQRNGEVSIGVTYMTGTLVKIGQRMSDALRGGDRTAWVPYLLLWIGMMAGAVTGASLFSWSPTLSLWGIATAAMLMVAVAFCVTRGLAVEPHVEIVVH